MILLSLLKSDELVPTLREVQNDPYHPNADLNEYQMNLRPYPEPLSCCQQPYQEGYPVLYGEITRHVILANNTVEVVGHCK